MIRRLGRSFLCPVSVALLGACSLFEKAPKSAEPKAAEPPKLVGRIASIPAGRKFVLIQSYSAWNVETGGILTTRGAENRSANLLVTGESLGQFAAADIQSGSVEVGDAVYSRHVPKATAAPANPLPEPELPENQATTTP